MENPLKSALSRGETSVGSWLSLASPFVARFLARTGFRWLTVDLEHSPVNWETAALMFAQIADAGIVPLARIPSNTHENIKRALDNGAAGIVVPMVNSREEAEAAVAATRYHPAGNRSVGGSLHALNFRVAAADYYRHASERIFVAVQTEHAIAVERADEIISVPGIDAIFVGPNDLLSSMGKEPAIESEDTEFVRALEHLKKTAERYGVAPGLHCLTVEQVKRRRADGWRFIALGSDLHFLSGSARAACGELGLGGDAP
ncbi:MAG TPA: aldolase/citrate lyase family protein, partial [Planctomycetota bacterium]|nr:aldolase/citrate lyase family protein [Planctomycetota bacterium]